MISNWCTLDAPWRCTCRGQSAPVSPPPMMITFLPLAVIGGSPSSPSTASPCCTRFATRAGTPSPDGCRPGRGRGWGSRLRSRRRPAPRRRTRAQLFAGDVHAASATPARNWVPSGRRSRRARGLDVALLHLELRDAVAQQPADAVIPLEHRHRVTGAGELLRRRRAVVGPDPMTATVLPVSLSGGSGTTQPSAKALSMISTSTCLMVTGSWLMPRTHDPSHGAGHSRPVTRGDLSRAAAR